MLSEIHPKLPMRNKAATKKFYETLGFTGNDNYPDYLMLRKDSIEIHWFLFEALDPAQNYGQVYIRCDNIDELYELAVSKGLRIPKAGHIKNLPWNQREFSLLDPDDNLLTFGQSLV